VLEIANTCSLNFFWTVERYRGFWGNSSGCNDFSGGDDDKSVSLWLPREVDDGVLDGVYNLHRHTLLSYTEDFQTGSEGLL
jgi:hypothetical protein